MEVRPFTESDLPEFNRWLALRGMLPLRRSSLPRMGRIVPGVAAGFLMQTDTDRAFLEPLLTNPEAPPNQRNDAINEIVLSLMLLAGGIGSRSITALVSQDANNLIARGVDGFGFVRANLPAHVVLTKEFA